MNEEDRYVDRNISKLEYYFDGYLINSVLNYIGGEGNTWDALNSCDQEYITVSTLDKVALNRRSPARSIYPSELPGVLKSHDGNVEIHSSMWSKDSRERVGYPRRTILIWDIEYFDHYDKSKFITNPKAVFAYLEPVYSLFQHNLDQFGVSYLVIMTGRGYHFITQIPSSSPVMDDLISVGNVIEPTVLSKQSVVPLHSKRTRPVPVNSELAYKGAVRMQQYLINKILRQAQDISRSMFNLSVEITDKGSHGISLDNTQATRTVDTCTLGVLGSPYFIKPQKISHMYGTLNRIPRKGGDYELTVDDLLKIRRSNCRSLDYISSVDCSIPDGSIGVQRMIDDYRHSPLLLLHQSMDSSFGDNPRDFRTGYRNYAAIIDKSSNKVAMADIIYNARPKLLEPANLDFLIWDLFKAWGGMNDLSVAPHIAGLIRSIYEDGRFNWEREWMTHYDALRHARGWVEQILGLDPRFTK